MRPPRRLCAALLLLTATTGYALGEGAAVPERPSARIVVFRDSIRILEQSPRWKPGRRNGRKVPVQYVMPVGSRPWP